MLYLSIREILELHEIIIETSGGALGIRDDGHPLKGPLTS